MRENYGHGCVVVLPCAITVCGNSTDTRTKTAAMSIVSVRFIPIPPYSAHTRAADHSILLTQMPLKPKLDTDILRVGCPVEEGLIHEVMIACDLRAQRPFGHMCSAVEERLTQHVGQEDERLGIDLRRLRIAMGLEPTQSIEAT